MGNKYLETKKDSLESSVLGVWQTAIEEGDTRMDGRTKQYKSHRSNLEAARLRREEKKKLNKEEVELDEGTWTLPKTPKQKAELKKLLSKPLKAKDATDKMYDIIGDDQLADDLDELADSDPNDDARDLVRSHMKRLGIKEEVELDEASGDKEAYKKFFDAALKKFKVSSPAEFKSDEEKKKFFDYIDKNWEGDNEKAEAAMSQVREFKIQSMKAALAQVWGMEEGKNPFVEHKGTKPHKHPHEEEEVVKKGKTETGKKPAAIDLKPKIDD